MVACSSYHGHLSGVYSLALHPSLDVLMTGGRDSVVRVWDMRTKVQVMVLSGHEQTVCSLLAQAPDPQVISGSHDSTIRLWDLRKGKASVVLTHHKKSIRAMAMHPQEYAFASASAENIKKFALPQGDFLHNMLVQQRAIVNCMAVNQEGVIATGGDNGSLWFWDWRSGHCFQADETQVQPGSMESEGSIFAASYDVSGERILFWKKIWDEGDVVCKSTEQARHRCATMCVHSFPSIALTFSPTRTACSIFGYICACLLLAAPVRHVLAAGSRLITCEGDKTVKMWKEVDDATPQTHPGLPFRPPKDIKRF